MLFNNEIQIFSIIKKYIFKLERQVKVNSWIQELKFLFYFPLGLVLGHFYVDRNAALALDIDNCGGLITESDGITRAIWTIDEKTLEIFRQEQKKITDQLLREGVRFDTVEFKSEKFTDTFHPTGINDQLIKNYSDCEIIGYEGLHVFSTGVLPGGYSSNPTASVLALVKSHFNAI